METLAAFLHGFPALCLFLSIVLGHIIRPLSFQGRRLRIRGRHPALRALSSALSPNPNSRTFCAGVFFLPVLSFRWATRVGPQFFGSLKKEALPQIGLALVVALTGLATVLTVTAAFGFNEGIAVGLLSGGMTQSAALGTGLSAIAELPIPDDVKTKLIADAPLADAITYGFGDLGLILFLTSFGPKDPARRSQRARRRRSNRNSAAAKRVNCFPARTTLCAATSSKAGRSLAPPSRPSKHATRMRGFLSTGSSEAARVLKPDPALTLQRGDRIVVSGRRTAFVDAERAIRARGG